MGTKGLDSECGKEIRLLLLRCANVCCKEAKHDVYDASNGLFPLFVNDEVHLHVDEARHIEMRLSRRELVAPEIEGGECDVSEGLNNER